VAVQLLLQRPHIQKREHISVVDFLVLEWLVPLLFVKDTTSVGTQKPVLLYSLLLGIALYLRFIRERSMWRKGPSQH